MIAFYYFTLLSTGHEIYRDDCIGAAQGSQARRKSSLLSIAILYFNLRRMMTAVITAHFDYYQPTRARLI
jgi:hypothetical protein